MPASRPDTSAAVAVVGTSVPSTTMHARGGLSRPPLPVTRRLGTATAIATVDIDERMDAAAAHEAAAPTQETVWAKVTRTLLVAGAGLAAWFLLPGAAAVRPAIALPTPLQGDIVLTADQREREQAALAALADAEPSKALGLLAACVDSGTASHRVWASYLSVLRQLDRDAHLLDAARAYATANPDRLEAAHFLAEGLLRQRIATHVERDGYFGSRVAPVFLDELEEAQRRVARALVLLAQRSTDWPHKDRVSWQDCLHFDAARLHDKRWWCADAPFRHRQRDDALAELDRIGDPRAENVVRLRLEIYRRLGSQWPTFSWSQESIGGHDHSKRTLEREITRLEDDLRSGPESP